VRNWCGIWREKVAAATARMSIAWKRRERGQIMILFAFSLIAMIGFVGLVVDLGLLMTARRSYQKIADTCAVVGAQSTLGPKLRAESCVTTNDMAVSDFTVNVPPSSGPFQTFAGDVEVKINRNYPTFFMRALGIQTMPIGVRAVAHSVTEWDYGLMGLKPGVEAVKSAGGPSTINGGACSAGDFKVAGNLNITGAAVANGSFNGAPSVTGGGTYSGAGSDPCEDPTYPLASPLPIPLALGAGGPIVNVNTPALCSAVPPALRIRITCPSGTTVTVTPPRLLVDIQGPNEATVDFMEAGNPSNATYQTVIAQGSGPVRLAPGWYDEIKVLTNNTNVEMKPGLYMINSAYEQGDGNLTGSGVSIIVGYEFRKTGGGTVTLSCCAPQMQNNVLIYHLGVVPLPGSSWPLAGPPVPPNAITIMGNNSTITLTGNIYSPLSAPCDDPCVQVGGNSTTMNINGQVAASTVEVNGTGFTLTFTGSLNNGARNPRLVE